MGNKNFFLETSDLFTLFIAIHIYMGTPLKSLALRPQNVINRLLLCRHYLQIPQSVKMVKKSLRMGFHSFNLLFFIKYIHYQPH